MSDSLRDEFAQPGDFPVRFDRITAHQLVRLANATSRRSFLSWVGRVSVAVLGGALVGVWRTESAWAGQCIQANNEFGELTRASCLCQEITGNNSCPNCCSGWWKSCPRDNADPAACFRRCSTDPPKIEFLNVRLWDCCAKCAGAEDSSRLGCSRFGNNWCFTPGADGYCKDGGCCGPGSGGGGCEAEDWRVKCVVKECTSNVCSGCVAPPS